MGSGAVSLFETSSDALNKSKRDPDWTQLQTMHVWWVEFSHFSFAMMGYSVQPVASTTGCSMVRVGPSCPEHVGLAGVKSSCAHHPACTVLHFERLDATD